MTRLSLALTAASLLSASSAFVPHPHQQSQRSKAAAFVVLAAKPKVFIDGEAGTTGLQVRDRLAKRDDLEIISAPDELRKDEATRKSLINEADAVILCTFVCVCSHPLEFACNDQVLEERKQGLLAHFFLLSTCSQIIHRPPRRRFDRSRIVG